MVEDMRRIDGRFRYGTPIISLSGARETLPAAIYPRFTVRRKGKCSAVTFANPRPDETRPRFGPVAGCRKFGSSPPPAPPDPCSTSKTLFLRQRCLARRFPGAEALREACHTIFPGTLQGPETGRVDAAPRSQEGQCLQRSGLIQSKRRPCL